AVEQPSGSRRIAFASLRGPLRPPRLGGINPGLEATLPPSGYPVILHFPCPARLSKRTEVRAPGRSAIRSRKLDIHAAATESGDARRTPKEPGLQGQDDPQIPYPPAKA